MSYLLISDYFGKWMKHPDVTHTVMDNAEHLVEKVNDLLEEAFEAGVDIKINPATKTYVAGQTYGGFRPQDCPQGAPQSSHKTGQAVDIFDPNNELDEWCYKHQDRLLAHDLFMEHPSATNHWCHLSTRAPKSGKRVFMP